MAESPGTSPDAEAPLVDAYLDHLRVSRRLASNSLEAYGRDLAQLARFAQARGLRLTALGRPDLEAFARGLGAAGYSPRSVAREVAGVRGFYRYLVVDRRLAASPAEDVRAPRAWPALPKALPLDVVDRLIEAPDRSGPKGLRDRALIEVL